MSRLIRLVFCLAICVSTPALAGFGSSLPRSEEVTLKKLIPFASWQKQFQITEGKDRGKVVPLSFHHDPTNGKHWKLIFGDYAGVYMRQDPDGTLAMERLDLFKSHSFILYEPALPVLSPALTAGGASRRQADFKMYDAETGKLKRIGRATHLLKQVSQSRFETPAGFIDGYFIQIDHRMNMQFAQLDLSLGLGCRLDDGPVFGSGNYTLTKLGLFTETKTAAAALTEITGSVSPLR